MQVYGGAVNCSVAATKFSQENQTTAVQMLGVLLSCPGQLPTASKRLLVEAQVTQQDMLTALQQVKSQFLRSVTLSPDLLGLIGTCTEVFGGPQLVNLFQSHGLASGDNGTYCMSYVSHAVGILEKETHAVEHSLMLDTLGNNMTSTVILMFVAAWLLLGMVSTYFETYNIMFVRRSLSPNSTNSKHYFAKEYYDGVIAEAGWEDPTQLTYVAVGMVSTGGVDGLHIEGEEAPCGIPIERRQLKYDYAQHRARFWPFYSDFKRMTRQIIDAEAGNMATLDELLELEECEDSHLLRQFGPHATDWHSERDLSQAEMAIAGGPMKGSMVRMKDSMVKELLVWGSTPVNYLVWRKSALVVCFCILTLNALSAMYQFYRLHVPSEEHVSSSGSSSVGRFMSDAIQVGCEMICHEKVFLLPSSVVSYSKPAFSETCSDATAPCFPR